MSFSQPATSSFSSPTSPRSTRRRKSRFTFKHLSQLGLYSVACPLRVIAHIDLDAFYAQCEMVRLGVSENQPLAVQQWQGLIAINYPAREFGLSRHVAIAEAQKKCPNIILQHVATWREGDEHWGYHEDAHKNIATHKVSLDPYRLQSRKILALIKEVLPGGAMQRVEKASIDEVFLDLSAQVHSILLERYPQLARPPPYDDPTEKLPAPPTTALDWNADALVDLDDGQREEDDPDWDDVAMLIGSEIIRSVRASIKERLKYTCSAGLARNKMLAKLGSGHKKPNQQTIVRNRAVQHFLADFKFTKIRMLGGKLGDEVVSAFGTDTVKELLDFSLDQLKAKLGDDTGSWLYATIRGEDHSEVNPRTQLKSMLSAKSFTRSINSFEQGSKWLRIFVADIYTRLVEEGVTENKRRPKTINLHHRQGGQTRSKQSPIPLGKSIDENLLFDLAKNLLAQVIVDGRAWPCSNLSLSVGGFEDGVTGNRGIGGFLVRGEEAKAMQHPSVPSPPVDSNQYESTGGPPQKRRRVEEEKTINQFFKRTEDQGKQSIDPVDFENIPSAQGESSELPDRFVNNEADSLAQTSGDEQRIATDPNFSSSPFTGIPMSDDKNNGAGFDVDKEDDNIHHYESDEFDVQKGEHGRSSDIAHEAHPNETPQHAEDEDDHRPKASVSSSRNRDISTFFCSRCNKALLADQQVEHEDFHFAQDLQNQDNESAMHNSEQQPAPSRGATNTTPRTGTGSKKASSTKKKPKGQQRDKGQKTLNFTS